MIVGRTGNGKHKRRVTSRLTPRFGYGATSRKNKIYCRRCFRTQLETLKGQPFYGTDPLSARLSNHLLSRSVVTLPAAAAIRAVTLNP
jgi:hypothetical protein